MSNVSHLPSTAERKERRLHLRDVEQITDPQVDLLPSIGAVLRAARLEHGQDTATVAAALKMRRDQVEAMEADDFARLPGRAYAIGFVTTYARHLGLDAAAVLHRFKEQTAARESAPPPDLSFPEAVEERRLPDGSILILALVIAMVIYGLSYVTMPDRKSATTAKAEEPVVIIEEPQADSDGVASSAKIEPGEQASFVAGDSSIADEPAPSADAWDAQLAAAFAVVQNIPQLPPVPESDVPSRIAFIALQPTYIEIREAKRSGRKSVLFARVLDVGESYRAPDRSGLVVQTGNAGGIQVEVDGHNIGVLGKSGQVIARMPVDASYFLERMAVSQ